MSGKFKLNRNDGGDTPLRRLSGHKTFKSAMIELGRDARRQGARDLNYQIRTGDVILFSRAGAAARDLDINDTEVAAYIHLIELRSLAYE